MIINYKSMIINLKITIEMVSFVEKVSFVLIIRINFEIYQ